MKIFLLVLIISLFFIGQCFAIEGWGLYMWKWSSAQQFSITSTSTIDNAWIAADTGCWVAADGGCWGSQ